VIAAAMRVAGKDLRSELRSKESLNAAVSVTIVLLLLFSFAFDPAAEETRQWAGGLLWLVYSFAAVLIVNRAFARETPNDCLEALRASPVPASALFLGKALASFLLLLAVELIALPAFAVFYNIQLTARPLPLAAAMLLATWGVVTIGAAFGAVTVNLHLRELMLPVLIYPMMIPALVAAIELTSATIADTPPLELWFRLLIAFDIIFTSLALMLAEVILTD
jgi:heme exporter protein B